MEDILGREVKEGDVIVVKPTGRDSHGLHLAVWHDDQVLLCRGWSGAYKTNYDQCFLVENPTEEEREIADGLIKKFYEQKKEKEDKKKKKIENALKRKDLKVWDQTDRGYFLGEVEIDGERYKNAFLGFRVYSNGEYYVNISCFSSRPHWDVLKNFPKVQPVTMKLDLTMDEIREAVESKRRDMDIATISYGYKGCLKPLLIIETGEIL